MRRAPFKPLPLLSAGALAVFCVLTIPCCTGVEVTPYYQTGALATAAPIATSIGQQLFEKGANAFDVAVAVGFILAVVHPQAGNIGGGGFALIRDGETGEMRALDFRETAPRQARADMYLDQDSNVVSDLSTHGALACAVPGTVAGLYELWNAYGSLPWDSLVVIAALLADTGFIVDEHLANSLERYRNQLNSFEETARIFLSNGRPPAAGERFMQKDLARTLYTIAAVGADGFYDGPVAQLVEDCMQRHGGIITRDDLRSYRPYWRQPIVFRFDSLDVYSMSPPSSGGIVMGQILGILQEYDFSQLTPHAPQYIHRFCEAARLAFADRAAHLGDPDFYDVPSGLLDTAYLSQRRALIDEAHATPSDLTGKGLPAVGEPGQTTHFSVCDARGNAVAITYTLNTSYGAKLVVDGAGFLLNNEMDDFAIKPNYPNTYGLVGGEANKIEPGKRMLSSMAPTIVLRDQEPFLVLGAPGGSRIITVVAQVILNLTRFNQPFQQALSQPRFHHQWRPDRIDIEQGRFDINVIQQLIRYGHTVVEREPFSDVQAVRIDKSGIMTAASDPRGRGTAGGY